MTKVLSSKKYTSGNFESWWYNLSNPEDWLAPESRIILKVKDSNNNEIGRIVLDMAEWYDRIIHASYHKWNNRKIVKVHVTKKNGHSKYLIYFGKTSDGVYPVKIESDL